MPSLGIWATVIARSKALAGLLIAGLLLPVTAMSWPLLQVRFLGHATVEEFPTQVANLSGLAGMLGFLSFALIALELRQRIAKGTCVREVLDSKLDGVRRTQAGLLVLVALLLILFAVLIELIVIVGANQLGISGAGTRNLALAVALNVVLPAFVGLLLGLNVSSMQSRVASYTTVIVILLLISPVTQEVVSGLILLLSANTPMRDWFILLAAPVLRIFALLAPDVGWYQDVLYMAPVEFSRWTLALLWVAALSLRLLIPGSRRRSSLVWLLSTVLLASLWVASSWLDSVPRHDKSPSSVSSGLHFLETGAAEKIPTGTTGVRANGGVRAESYDLDLAIDRRLNARAKVTIAGQGTSGADIPFTLFRGYRVSRVTDGTGKNLEFEQVGDVVRVTPAGDGAYVFDYAGSGWRFYSNHQGTLLPSTFPWYPWPGVHRYFDSQRSSNPFLAPQTAQVPFSVSVESKLSMFSNLGELTSEPATGTTSGLILLGGNVGMRSIGTWDIVGPPESTPGIDSDTVMRELRDMSTRLAVQPPSSPAHFALFVSSRMADADGSLNFPTIAGDYALSDVYLTGEILARRLAIGILLADVPADSASNDMFLLLRNYLVDPEVFLQTYRHRPLAMDDGRGTVVEPDSIEILAWTLASKIRRDGERAVVSRILEYLRQPAHSIAPDEFLSAL